MRANSRVWAADTDCTRVSSAPARASSAVARCARILKATAAIKAPAATAAHTGTQFQRDGHPLDCATTSSHGRSAPLTASNPLALIPNAQKGLPDQILGDPAISHYAQNERVKVVQVRHGPQIASVQTPYQIPRRFLRIRSPARAASANTFPIRSNHAARIHDYSHMEAEWLDGWPPVHYTAETCRH